MFRDFAEADAAEIAFWLSLPVEARVDLAGRLRVELCNERVETRMLDPDYSDRWSAFRAHEVSAAGARIV